MSTFGNNVNSLYIVRTMKALNAYYHGPEYHVIFERRAENVHN